MARHKIKIATLNINGMKTPSTQCQLLHILDTYKFHILFIQETHVDNMSLGNVLKQKFNCEAFWSFGTNRSTGVTTFIFPHCDSKIEKFDTDMDGRFLLIDLQINSIPFRLINIYAPNNEKDRKYFFNNISKYLVTSRNLIFGGDFNCILNTRYDKIGKGANPQFGHVGSKELSNLCNNYNLIDIFRHFNPHKYATTWHAPISKDIHTRLDRFYVSDSLVSNDPDFNFYPVSFSDHDIFSFEFNNFDTPEVGPNYWKGLGS